MLAARPFHLVIRPPRKISGAAPDELADDVKGVFVIFIANYYKISS
jgi:hypothetical protein